MPDRFGRPTTVERGYGPAHRRLKKIWAERLKAVGALPCAEPVHKRGCPGLIVFGMPFDLPHDRVNGGYRDGISWPACNRAEGARYGNARRAARRRPRVPGGVFGPLSS